MDAKRIVPVLQVQGGRVTAQSQGVRHPWELACRLELEGADGIIFQDADTGPARGEWIRKVAEVLSIPFEVAAPFRHLEDLGLALDAGADRVILASSAAASLLPGAAQRFGPGRLGVAVDAVVDPGAGWRVPLADRPGGREALGWLAELEQWGAGAILLATTAVEAPELFQRAARLALGVLCHSDGDLEPVADALLHGADGLAFPALTRSPEAWKGLLAGRGFSLRPA